MTVGEVEAASAVAPPTEYSQPWPKVVAPVPPLPTVSALPRVSEPREPSALKRLVLDAVVAKKFVVVAEVPVAEVKVKDWRVEEALARKPPLKSE